MLLNIVNINNENNDGYLFSYILFSYIYVNSLHLHRLNMNYTYFIYPICIPTICMKGRYDFTLITNGEI